MCVEQQHFGQWGEDMFIDQCLHTVHHLTAPIEPRLMCEDHCDCRDYYWCKHGPQIVSYHPFKTVAAYENCIANAVDGPPAPAITTSPAPEKTTEAPVTTPAVVEAQAPFA